MSVILDATKRLLVGRPLRSDHLGRTLLPKRLALPVFSSDALSSMAYAPDEILLMLAVAGLAATTVSPWVGAAVGVMLLVVVASYRQNVRAYPSGGGDYEIVTENLGPTAGLGVGAALLVDYTLTVAVSVSSGAQYAASALPALRGYEVLLAVGIVAFLTLMNLRGVRESSRVFAVPVYCFMALMGAMAVTGAIRHWTGTLPPAESAGFEIVPAASAEQGLVGLAGALLVARAFASGAVALTGVEAISNGVPAFRRPKGRNAANTLAMLGIISAGTLMMLVLLAQATGVRYAEDPHTQLTSGGEPLPADYVQHPVISQLAEAVFGGAPLVFYLTVAVTGLVLLLAANTAFAGFPVLGSILGRDGFLPRQLHTRGDRLAFSNGILTLGAAAIVLVVVFDGRVTALVQLYIVGVFVSFTLSQLGMVRHWSRRLRTEVRPDVRRRMKRSRAVNAVGLVATSTVLVIVLVTKFTHGAWITVLAIAGLFVVMRGIRKHYDRVSDELALRPGDDELRALPSRVHAIVLVSKVHKPTVRALSYARAFRPQTLEAVTVGVDRENLPGLMREWEALDLPVPLRVLDSPFREITKPVLKYVRSVRRESPRDLVVVYIPEYVVGRWWEQLLHNQSALRLKGGLLFTPGVVVASVPWQLASTAGQTGLEGVDAQRKDQLR